MILYSYTKFYEYHRFGIPVMRPLLMEFPDSIGSFFYNDQYMFGDIFMIKADDEIY